MSIGIVLSSVELCKNVRNGQEHDSQVLRGELTENLGNTDLHEWRARDCVV